MYCYSLLITVSICLSFAFVAHELMLLCNKLMFLFISIKKGV